MHVFISWSGDRSHKIAQALYDWLPKILPSLKGKLFISSEIDKGVHWFSQIVRELEHADIGLICLTPEGLNSNWLYFEAGALAKHLDSTSRAENGDNGIGSHRNRLYTYLYQVKPGQLTGPLSAYQSTSATRDDTERLIKSIADIVQEEPGENNWHKSFSEHWAELEEKLSQIVIPVQELIPEFKSFFERKTFNESLHDCTAQNWIERYNGARDTYRKLQSYFPMVRDVCPRYQVDLFESLQVQVDAYVMNTSLLLKPVRLEDKEDHKMDIPLPSKVIKACERCRLKIKDVVRRILEPLNSPKMDDSVRFMVYETFEQKKDLVHSKENKIRDHKDKLRNENGENIYGEEAWKDLIETGTLREYRSSQWELERIYYYLIMEYLEKPSEINLQSAIEAVQIEMEKVRSKTETASLMPLSYALGALQSVIPDLPVPRELVNRLKKVLKEIEDYIKADPDTRDTGNHIKNTIAEVRDRINDKVSSNEDR